jgi:hypothetical protein
MQVGNLFCSRPLFPRGETHRLYPCLRKPGGWSAHGDKWKNRGLVLELKTQHLYHITGCAILTFVAIIIIIIIIITISVSSSSSSSDRIIPVYNGAVTNL